jgi:hypothetical protein
VRSVSSQYSDASWSAAHVLGPPDVFPANGDQPNAWASREADAGVEYIEVGFAEARRVSGVDLYETYNPGAVTRVEVITADGQSRPVYEGSAAPLAQPAIRRHLAFACTDSPIVAVRVTLDSKAVPGWNEIDAIGAEPCDDPVLSGQDSPVTPQD